jgi:hypothetical protein
MADNRTITGQAGRVRINMNEDYEVRYWTQKWNISREELAAAAHEAGVGKGCGKKPWQGTLNPRMAICPAIKRQS